MVGEAFRGVCSRIVHGLACSVLVFSLAGCSSGVLAPKGPVGAGERMILFDALALMLVIVVPTIIAILGFAWWFRASNTKAKRLPNWAFSGALEISIWAIPLLTIMFLGGMTWIASHQLDPYKPLDAKTRPLEVQVVSLDWKWLFIYPDQQLASVNELVVPAGTSIHFSLTSASVMNAFFVPQLGSMIYTMNGMATQLNLEADQPGVFPGLSSHYSGDGFVGMHFNVRASSPAQFQAWVQGAKASGSALDANSYAVLSRQSSNVAPYTYRSVQPGLFQSIVTQEIAPSPGPVTSAPSLSAPHQGH